MKFILIFGISFLVNSAFSEILSPPGEYLSDSFSTSLDEVKSDVKETDKKDVKEAVKADDNKPVIKVKPTTPIVTGGVGKATVKQDEPTIRSVMSDQNGGSSASGSERRESKTSNEPGLVDVPENILQAVKQDELANLRGGNAEIKPNAKSDGIGEENGDKTDSEPKKIDPILASIEGAEKQLSEAFGAVRSKIMTMGSKQKPIKVDCGTTRVRVVCSKKGEPEVVESKQTPEKSENPVKKEKKEKPVAEPVAEPEQEPSSSETENAEAEEGAGEEE